MTTKPSVLITSPSLAFIVPKLADSYNLIKWWEAPDDEALASVRVLTCLGHEDLSPVMDRLPGLEFVACFTTGYDGIDVDRCIANGISLTNAPAMTAPAVAEYALALTLALVRNVVFGRQLLLDGKWYEGVPMMGSSIRGSRIGVIGLGEIGRTFADYAQMLGAEMRWWGPRPKPDAAWPQAASLEALVSDSDIIVICVRADASTHHLISAELIGKMSPCTLIVNVARGQLIDEEALLAALRAGRIGGAALDVFEIEPTPADRWAGLPNVIVTPHLGGATWQTAMAMLDLLQLNLERFFAGEPLATPVIAANK